MGYRSRFSLVWLIAVLLVTTATAQRHYYRPQVEDSKKFKFEITYDVSVPGDTRTIELTVVIARSIPGRQEIYDVEFSPKPESIFAKDGTGYAQFVFFKAKKDVQIKIKGKAKLTRYDFETARKKNKNDPASQSDLKQFLKQETYIEKDDPLIKQIAAGITGADRTVIVKNAFDYVVKNMEYAGFKKRNRGALKAAKEKKGDCTEYADLFVAICRAKNIPARVVSGYGVRFDDVTPKHSWAEVYFEKYGWIPFDSTVGDSENTFARNWAFEMLEPVYIRLSHTRNDKILDNHAFCAWHYWGDKITVKDSIKFKKISNTSGKTP